MRVLFWLLLATAACQPPSPTDPTDSAAADTIVTPTFAGAIEAAHGADRWRAHSGSLSADVTVTFGGQTRLAGRFLFDTDGHRVLMRRGDTTAFYDESGFRTVPETAVVPRGDFWLPTVAYFLQAPLKLNDPGAVLTPGEDAPLRGKPHPTARLTFDPGTGASPDDWYVLYRDPTTDRLAAMAYIVTYGDRSVEDAEANPHAITYGGYQTVEGAVVSTEWTFWNWRADEGIYGDPIGKATLENVAFVGQRAVE